MPDHLTALQQEELAELGRGDERVRAALAASGPEGDVMQHLTGGPELLRAYIDGALFSPSEHALITATLDARRLGTGGRFRPYCWQKPPTATSLRASAPVRAIGLP